MLQGRDDGMAPSGIGAPGTPAPAMVVFVIARAAVRQRLRATIEHVVNARIVMAETVLDALLRVARVPADLVVIDLSHDALNVPALLRHLARVDAPTEVLVFDDIDSAEHRAMYAVLPWDQAEAALRRWFDRFRHFEHR